MDVQKNARLTVFCRELLVDWVFKGLAKAQVAGQFGVSVQTVREVELAVVALPDRGRSRRLLRIFTETGIHLPAQFMHTHTL